MSKKVAWIVLAVLFVICLISIALMVDAIRNGNYETVARGLAGGFVAVVLNGKRWAKRYLDPKPNKKALGAA